MIIRLCRTFANNCMKNMQKHMVQSNYTHFPGALPVYAFTMQKWSKSLDTTQSPIAQGNHLMQLLRSHLVNAGFQATNLSLQSTCSLKATHCVCHCNTIEVLPLKRPVDVQDIFLFLHIRLHKSSWNHGPKDSPSSERTHTHRTQPFSCAHPTFPPALQFNYRISTHSNLFKAAAAPSR